MKLMVLDGNSIVNRAYYGVRTMLKTRDGLYTMASIRELGWKVGGTAYAVIKATSVMVGVD